jgi:hypothetical protein
MKYKVKTAGLSLPSDLFERIEHDRADVSRSRFLLRILQEHYEKQKGVSE